MFAFVLVFVYFFQRFFWVWCTVLFEKEEIYAPAAEYRNLYSRYTDVAWYCCRRGEYFCKSRHFFLAAVESVKWSSLPLCCTLSSLVYFVVCMLCVLLVYVFPSRERGILGGSSAIYDCQKKGWRAMGVCFRGREVEIETTTMRRWCIAAASIRPACGELTVFGVGTEGRRWCMVWCGSSTHFHNTAGPETGVGVVVVVRPEISTKSREIVHEGCFKCALNVVSAYIFRGLLGRNGVGEIPVKCFNKFFVYRRRRFVVIVVFYDLGTEKKNEIDDRIQCEYVVRLS